MPTLRALELETQLDWIAASPVCALVGEDEAQVGRSLQLLQHAAAPLDQPGSIVRRLEGEVAPHEVFDELRTIPFMGLAGRRVVIVEDGASFLKRHGDRLLSYLENPTATATLVLCVRKLDRRTKAAKAIAAVGAVVECARLKWTEAQTWLRAEAERMGKELHPRAAAALVEAVGPNLLALRTELDKLAAYCAGQESIPEEAVAEVVAHGRTRSVFDLADAVARGDAAEALRLTGRLLLAGERRESIIWLLARQVRRLWMVLRLRRQKTSEGEIARQLGMQDWMVRRAAQAGDGLSDEWFSRRLQLLSDADYESKTQSLRAGEEGVWLENLMARLLEG
jgi:DNA polymerase-3 subunit delta